MKFYIDSSDFFLRDESRGSATLMNLKTNQVVYINSSGRKLFEHCDEQVDFDAFIDSLDYPSVSREKLCADYKTLLLKLYAGGFLKLSDIERCTDDGCFIAQAEDVDALSQFLRASCANANSCAVAAAPVYYSRYAVYSHITNGRTPYFYLQRGGRIVAVVDAQAAALGMGESVVTFNSFFFAKDMSEGDCAEAVKALVALAASVAAPTASKLRYVYMNPRQDKTVAMLAAVGFEQTARLEKEVNSERGITLYDLFLG